MLDDLDFMIVFMATVIVIIIILERVRFAFAVSKANTILFGARKQIRFCVACNTYVISRISVPVRVRERLTFNVTIIFSYAYGCIVKSNYIAVS